jgi:hypothetical protein
MLLIRRFILAFSALVLLVMASISPAAAAGDYGKKFFELDDRSFQATDRNGTFNAQVTYVTGGRPFRNNPVAFSFTISPYLRSIATSNMHCQAWQTKSGSLTGASDNHASIPPDYLWHWSFPDNPMGADMAVNGACSFLVNVGGRTGRANVSFIFRYVVDDGGGRE